MTPFVSWSYRPNWFKMAFPASSHEDEREIHDTWMEFFKPFISLTRISTAIIRFRMAAYYPNLVVKQFVFSQFLPKSFFAKEESIFLAADEQNEEWYQNCWNFYTKKAVHLNPFEFLPFSIVQKNLNIGGFPITVAWQILWLWFNV